MGIELVYRRLPRDQFEQLQSDPEQADAFLGTGLPGLDLDDLMAAMANPEVWAEKGDAIRSTYAGRDADPTRLELGKDWHVLHFLLTGESSTEPGHREGEPLHNVVMGGRPAGFEATYGPARWLDAETVREVASALAGLAVEELRARFSAEAFDSAEIYPRPMPGGWEVGELDGLLEVYPRLVQFFREAAAAGEVMVVYAA
ncbi:MAG: YfbM family protein [Acidobacteriota bacterium]